MYIIFASAIKAIKRLHFFPFYHSVFTKQSAFIKSTSVSRLLLSLERLSAVEAREALQGVIARVDAANSEQIAVIAKTYVQIGWSILSIDYCRLFFFLLCAVIWTWCCVDSTYLCVMNYQIKRSLTNKCFFPLWCWYFSSLGMILFLLKWYFFLLIFPRFHGISLI